MNEQLRIREEIVYIGQVTRKYAWPMAKVGDNRYVAALPRHEGVTWNESTFRPGDILGRDFVLGAAVDLSETIENHRLVFLEGKDGLWLRLAQPEERLNG